MIARRLELIIMRLIVWASYLAYLLLLVYVLPLVVRGIQTGRPVPVELTWGMVGMLMLLVILQWPVFRLRTFLTEHCRNNSVSRIYFWASMLMPDDKAELVIGDIEERLPKRVERYGKQRARMWIWKQVIWACWNEFTTKQGKHFRKFLLGSSLGGILIHNWDSLKHAVTLWLSSGK